MIIETLQIWTEYKEKYKSDCEFSEVDAAELNSVDNFAPWFDNWISSSCCKTVDAVSNITYSACRVSNILMPTNVEAFS
jgi:hypothetical protein